jgi:hypothetical protein
LGERGVCRLNREKRRSGDDCAQYGGENPAIPFLCQFHWKPLPFLKYLPLLYHTTRQMEKKLQKKLRAKFCFGVYSSGSFH